MNHFKESLTAAHGTILRAWKTIDDDGSGRIERHELKEAMAKIKWDGDVDKIFDMLDYDHSGFISIDEIDIDTARALARGDDILFGLDFSPEKFKVGPDATFHERQAAHSMHMRKEAAGKMRKKRVEELAAEKKKMDVGARDKAGFLKVLQGKYGNVYRAWKVGMDTDGNGRLSKNEFMEVARHHGYAGKLLDLWNECCKPTDSFVRLDDLSPEAYKMTTEFTDLIVREYGSRNSGGRLSTPDKKKELVETWLRAWICALDTDKTGRVELGEFQEVCTKLNFGYDDAYVKRLYYWYDYDRSGAISLEELDVAASQAMQRGDSRFLDVSWCRKLDAVGNMDNVMAMADRAQNEVAKERRAKAVAQRKKHDEEKKAEKEKDMGMTSLKDLRKVLILKYGNMYRAWNLYLDKDKSGTLTFLEFCDQLRGLGYAGDLKAIWEELDEDDGGTISFVEFCPKEAVLVDGLKHAMIQKSGSIARCWVEQFDQDKSGKVEKDEFMGACKRIQYGEDQAEKIFKLFDLDRSGNIALEEIDEEAMRAVARGDVELGLDLMVHDNSDGKTMAQRRKEALMKAQRDEQAALIAAEKAMDIRASDKAGFVSELKRKFGNLYRAWSLAMDTSGDGKLTFQEFGNAVRMQSYGGDIKALWKTYVKEGQIEGGEIVTLEDFAPVEYALVTEFRTKMIAKHRSLARGWVECLDKVKN